MNKSPETSPQLTSTGRRILRQFPTDPEVTIGIRELAERTRSLGDYSGFTNMIGEFAAAGYVTIDRETSQLALTDKARAELSPEPEQELKPVTSTK